MACLVYELNRQKLRLELLAKRNEAHDCYKKIIGIYVRFGGFIDLTNNTNPEDEAIILAHKFKTYSIYFGSDIEELSSRLVKWVADFATTDKMARIADYSNPNRERLIKELGSLTQEYSSFVVKIDDSIKPYLQITEPAKLSVVFWRFTAKVQFKFRQLAHWVKHKRKLS